MVYQDIINIKNRFFIISRYLKSAIFILYPCFTLNSIASTIISRYISNISISLNLSENINVYRVQYYRHILLVINF